MIIKGKSRGGPGALAEHLGNAEKNERVTLLETRGTVAQDMRGALIEMDACAVGTRCEKPLYHAAMSPGPPHRLTPEQREQAIDALEGKLGLAGHQRLVVMHEKHGREHIHVVWSRIDLERMRSVSDSHNYRKHEEVARDLERRFGHDRVQGAHHERDGVERPPRTPSRAELRQEERTGIKSVDVRRDVTEAFQASDGPQGFIAALNDKGYLLAQGDRRDFVIIDWTGGIHSLARRLDMKAVELRAFMAPLKREGLPNIEEARELIAQEQGQARAVAAIKKTYARGDDYVSQTTAAQKDFKYRQDVVDADFRPNIPDEREGEDRDIDRENPLRRRHDQSRTREEAKDGMKSSPKSSRFGNIEITEAMQARMERLINAQGERGNELDRDDDWEPDRQNEAPGGGRTRGQ